MSRPTTGVTRDHPGLSLTFDASSSQRIVQHMQRLAAVDARHWVDVRREMGEWMLGQVQDNFDKQRLADHTPMPQSKAAIKRRGKTLIHKHHLYDSYVSQLTADTVEVGSNKAYARIHHFGGATGKGHKTHIAARPVLGLTDAQAHKMGDFIIREIQSLQ